LQLAAAFVSGCLSAGPTFAHAAHTIDHIFIILTDGKDVRFNLAEMPWPPMNAERLKCVDYAQIVCVENHRLKEELQN
jgi:hypothetical protein